MNILRLSLQSLGNRRYTAWLTLCTIAFSVALLLGVEKVRSGARAGFASTLSGTDLIVGARGGEIPLLLYSVFRLGDATNNLSWSSYQEIAALPQVRWTIPLALGDSHRGYRVLGTNGDYFRHYRYGRRQALAFAAGRPFADVYEAVLGAEVADALGYRLGRSIVVAHGVGEANLLQHQDKPFTVVGILERTGTPVDRTVHVSLEGITAMHVDWVFGVPLPGLSLSAEQARTRDLTPKTITAFLVGLDSRVSTFHIQRQVNDYRAEPLLAVIPGVALGRLWELIGVAEQALLIVSGCVVLTGLAGMLAVLLAGLEERRRELAILRSVGARPGHLFALLAGEAGGFAVAGGLLGTALLYGALYLLRPLVESRFGLYLELGPPGARELALLGGVAVAGLLLGLIPAYRAYRHSLADGMTIRI